MTASLGSAAQSRVDRASFPTASPEAASSYFPQFGPAEHTRRTEDQHEDEDHETETSLYSTEK